VQGTAIAYFTESKLFPTRGVTKLLLIIRGKNVDLLQDSGRGDIQFRAGFLKRTARAFNSTTRIGESKD
jgi:hypothetical protein